MTHQLKIDKQYFDDITVGKKRFEIRFNDRNYVVGDKIILKEIDEIRNYTGKKVFGVITYLTDYEQKDGYVVFGFDLVDE